MPSVSTVRVIKKSSNREIVINESDFNLEEYEPKDDRSHQLARQMKSVQDKNQQKRPVPPGTPSPLPPPVPGAADPSIKNTPEPQPQTPQAPQPPQGQPAPPSTTAGQSGSAISSTGGASNQLPAGAQSTTKPGS